MKKLKKYILRKKSIISDQKNLEIIYKFKDFPVFLGCVDSPVKNDLVANMEWAIDKDTGMIQLVKLIPLKTLYLNQHNDSIGKIWEDLYKEFSLFILSSINKHNILEIGGAHDKLANYVLDANKKTRWTIIEPNPQNIRNKKIKIIKGWFDKKFMSPDSFDTIVHSHVLEHVYNPDDFLKSVADLLRPGQKHFFVIPNMLPMLKNKFTNCLNFEHTTFLTEYFTDYLLKRNGFKILEKKYYGNPHSIFYATEKLSQKQKQLPIIKSKYNIYKKIFMNFIVYHKKMINSINLKMRKTKDPVYLFGAHIFSTYLFAFGLKKDKIISILDNSPLKQGKRLYGTNLMVESPKKLKDKGPVNVILKAGIYNEEIKKDILENINSKVNFW
jgi:SAM-dependent methyltransferase